MASMTASRDATSTSIEHRAREIGRVLFAKVGGGPKPWERGWWDDRMMNLTLGDPLVKVQLFRFIDAMPVLKTPTAIRRHLVEYLDEAGDRVPWWLRLAVALAPAGTLGERALAGIARFGATHMARRFIAGATPDEALKTVLALRRQRIAFTADLLGEAVISEHEAERYQQTCLDLIRGLARPLGVEPEIPQIDRDHRGSIPRVNLSLKLTSLTARFDALYDHSTLYRVARRLRPILRTARDLGAYVHVDMEQYAHKDLTLAIFKSVLSEPEFRDWPDVGIVIQGYLTETEADLGSLLDWVKQRGTPITVRLVKGAYWDYEVVLARQLGWPIPVYLHKWQTDACYERSARFLMEHHEQLRPALGSHNVRSLALAMAAAETYHVPDDSYEIQMLHGMGEPIQRALVADGKRVRVYTPYGAMLPGMAYLVRRLLENTSNESFLKASFTDHAQVEELLRDPEEVGAMWGRNQPSQRKPGSLTANAAAPVLTPFQNEPPTDFTRPEARAAMSEALRVVRGQFGRVYPLVLNGRAVATGTEFTSTDPSETASVVGRFVQARPEDARQAIAIARERLAAWSATPAADRASVLLKAAALMRAKRSEISAWEVYECGKPWREADGDVAEAIDFCEFYAREMIRLAEGKHRDVPGETNAIERIARGVVAVIPPWNFPLAIPTGMTVAALVAGNTVVLKPSERAPRIALLLGELLREAGLPEGVLTVLPGFGDVGKALVDDPRVALIAFTGSRDVGLEINRKAAEPAHGQNHVKRVIAEMGGKNAIIVDDDSDLDEAVVGVLQSAFGYAGQKCSACSRVIVLDGVYDAFVARLVDAARALPVGPADNPDTAVGPVIDAKARVRVEGYKTIAEGEGDVVLSVDVGPLVARGNYVGPLIVAGVHPDARIAQEEVFGPVLAVLRASDLNDALRIANGTVYALTGGLYSRSPANIDRVKREFRVGNLYVNRPITGALVDRQPFGGFQLSGIGTKAGGTDYLLEFLLTRTITENTMRRGFAPESDGASTAATPTNEAALGV
ncbi:L-proline dehydrogenase [Singulisphaera sp. GP187]|nr:L-proline dehydrogenase [Singulisphaera sp. GP187]